MKKTLVLATLVSMLFATVSCESSKGLWESAKDQVQASATGTVGVVPNGEGGYEAKAEGSTGLFGKEVYGSAKVGFRDAPEAEPLPVPVSEELK